MSVERSGTHGIRPFRQDLRLSQIDLQVTFVVA